MMTKIYHAFIIYEGEKKIDKGEKVAKKLTDLKKVEKVQELIQSALYQIEFNRRDKNLVGMLARLLCLAHSTLMADKDDDFMIQNVALRLELRVNGIEQKELPFTEDK